MEVWKTLDPGMKRFRQCKRYEPEAVLPKYLASNLNSSYPVESELQSEPILHAGFASSSVHGCYREPASARQDIARR